MGKKNLSISDEELDWMWNFCATYPNQGGGLIHKLDKQGIGWRDLNERALKTLPDVYEKVYKDVMENGVKEDEND